METMALTVLFGCVLAVGWVVGVSLVVVGVAILLFEALPAHVRWFKRFVKAKCRELVAAKAVSR